MERLRCLISKRTAIYAAEEKALRVMLEGEQEEERKRDREIRQKKEKEKLLQKKREVDFMLFGGNSRFMELLNRQDRPEARRKILIIYAFNTQSIYLLLSRAYHCFLWQRSTQEAILLTGKATNHVSS